MHLNTPVSALPTATKALCARLKTLGIGTAKDLIFYFPFRYEDFKRIVPVNQLKAGESVSVRGVISLIAYRRSWKRRGSITEILLSDNTGELKIICFNQPYLSKILARGQQVVAAGMVREGHVGIQMINPTIEKAVIGKELVHTARLVPIYSVTVGVTQRNLRFLIKQALACVRQTREPLPSFVMRAHKLMPLYHALINIHFPSSASLFEQARRRFAFEELFILQARSRLRRRNARKEPAYSVAFDQHAIKRFVGALPFPLTKDQRITAWEIVRDMQNATPMNRLLQGDVGSGKTIVGALACLDAALQEFQSAWLAPTEILARQHFQTFVAFYRDLPDVRIALLTSGACDYHDAQSIKDKKVSHKQIISFISAGKVNIVIGTHALLYKPVAFHRLALLIVDEQHRFGVRQRHALEQQVEVSAAKPHFLSMTATPIPRSLALIVYGDLSISSIKTMPAGRRGVISRVVPSDKREAAYEFIRAQIKAGRQAYIVCPLIEPGLGEQTAAFGYNERKAVLDEYNRLHEQIFPDIRIALLHGKMKSVEKERVRADFARGQIDMLVSTTVVEVGIDVPNASVMVIEGADRFGLAQLHQLRGRVGRAEHQSYCLLFAEDVSVRAKRRLEFFVETTDGFKLAEQDLLWRGPGEVYGTQQSGFLELKFARFSDTALIAETRTAADECIKKTPDMRVYPELYARMAIEDGAHLE